jgi:hypothetical protein
MPVAMSFKRWLFYLLGQKTFSTYRIGESQNQSGQFTVSSHNSLCYTDWATPPWQKDQNKITLSNKWSVKIVYVTSVPGSCECDKKLCCFWTPENFSISWSTTVPLKSILQRSARYLIRHYKDCNRRNIFTFLGYFSMEFQLALLNICSQNYSRDFQQSSTNQV